MARRQTVKQAVAKAREEHPEARIDVLYPIGGGWAGRSDWAILPETEWDAYRVNNVCEYTDGKGTVNLVLIETS